MVIEKCILLNVKAKRDSGARRYVAVVARRLLRPGVIEEGSRRAARLGVCQRLGVALAAA